MNRGPLIAGLALIVLLAGAALFIARYEAAEDDEGRSGANSLS